MSADINNIKAGDPRDRSLVNAQEANQQSKEVDRSKEAQQRANTAATEKVELSDDARSLARLAEASSEEAGFDQSRVDSIRQAIAEGQYHVDAKQLAQHFLDLEIDLSQ